VSDPVAGPATRTPPLPPGPFVFVTVGTDKHPFDRMVRLAESWAARTGFVCFIQSGTSNPPADSEGADYLPFPMMADAMRSAAAVVCHGGPATIMLARQNGRVPIVMPRDPHRGEHVDGHQIEFSRWMAEKGQIVLAESVADLESHLDAAVADPARYRVDADEDGGTGEAVRRFAELVDDLLDRKRPR
jgi:UDP-N-acetylglucosamine transferase subunit ALG13